MTAELLEETIFWLVDAMGFKDLVWRIGGETINSPDGGRDLEASFYVKSPTGDPRPESWWFEVRHSKGTVDADNARKSVINATDRKDLDVFVIATNSRFSNPFRDWLKDWRIAHPRPIVDLWDRHRLERMIVHHPSVVLRVAPEALSDQGWLDALGARFQSQLYLPSLKDLARMWQSRRNLEWTEWGLLAMIVGEMSNGDLRKHPWTSSFTELSLFLALVTVLLNRLPTALRLERFGIKRDPIDKAEMHLVLACLLRLRKDAFKVAFKDPYSFSELATMPTEVREELHRTVFKPLLLGIVDELFPICASDCDRIQLVPDTDDLKPLDLWRQFVPAAVVTDPIEEQGGGFMFVETLSAPCRVGFSLSKTLICPFRRAESMSTDELIDFLEHVVVTRATMLFGEGPFPYDAIEVREAEQLRRGKRRRGRVGRLSSVRSKG